MGDKRHGEDLNLQKTDNEAKERGRWGRPFYTKQGGGNHPFHVPWDPPTDNLTHHTCAGHLTLLQ